MSQTKPAMASLTSPLTGLSVPTLSSWQGSSISTNGTVLSLKPGCNYATSHERDSRTSQETMVWIIMSLDQHEATALLPNRANCTIQSQVIPGISDYHVPLIEVDVRPLRNVKKPRDIPRLKSASWDEFKDYITTKGQEITLAPSDADMDTPWRPLEMSWYTAPRILFLTEEQSSPARKLTHPASFILHAW